MPRTGSVRRPPAGPCASTILTRFRVRVMDTPAASPPPAVRARQRPVYVPAIGPRLRVLLFVVFGVFAVLGATGVYLAAVTRSITPGPRRATRPPFSLWVFLAHSAIGVIGDVAVPGVRGVPLGDGPQAAEPRGRAARPPRVPVRAARLPDRVRPHPTRRAAATADRVVRPVGGLLAARRRAGRWPSWLYVEHRRAGPAIKWRLAPRVGRRRRGCSPSAWWSCTRRTRSGGSARGRRRGRSTSSRPRPATGRRQVHPRRHADDGRRTA